MNTAPNEIHEHPLDLDSELFGTHSMIDWTEEQKLICVSSVIAREGVEFAKRVLEGEPRWSEEHKLFIVDEIINSHNSEVVKYLIDRGFPHRPVDAKGLEDMITNNSWNTEDKTGGVFCLFFQKVLDAMLGPDNDKLIRRLFFLTAVNKTLPEFRMVCDALLSKGDPQDEDRKLVEEVMVSFVNPTEEMRNLENFIKTETLHRVEREFTKLFLKFKPSMDVTNAVAVDAAKNGCSTVCMELVDAGAVKFIDQSMRHAKRWQEEFIAHLAKRDPSHLDAHLLNAYKDKQLKVVNSILESGLSISKDVLNKLMYMAVERNDIQTSSKLLSIGVDPHDDDEKIVQIAVNRGYKKLAELLRCHAQVKFE